MTRPAIVSRKEAEEFSVALGCGRGCDCRASRLLASHAALAEHLRAVVEGSVCILMGCHEESRCEVCAGAAAALEEYDRVAPDNNAR